MIKFFTSWYFRCITYNSMKRIKTLFTVYKHLHLFHRYLRKMCKICKWDDWWHHTLDPILSRVYKSSFLGQFAAQTIEIWQANSSTGKTPAAKKASHGNSLFSSLHALDFNMLVIFSLKNFKQGHKLVLTYLCASWIMHMRHHL